MAFKVKYSDVLKYEGDALLNSLGTDGRIYGRLCKSVIEGAKDDSLKEFVDSKTNSKIGDIFVTGAGDLAVKNVIHLVTPFKKFDDDNEKLKSAYSAVIKTAIDMGCKTLGLPFVGTGANGYSEADAYDAVTSACAEISVQEEKENRDIIDITVIAYLKKNSLADEYCEICGKPRTFSNQLSIYGAPPDGDRAGRQDAFDDPFYECMHAFDDMKRDEFVDFDVDNCLYPYSFVDKFMMDNDVDERVLSKGGLDRKRKYKMRKQKNLAKIDVFRIALILKMTRTQTLQFMLISGHTFSPINDVDLFYLNYINGIYDEVENIYGMDGLAFDEGMTFMHGEHPFTFEF